MNNSIKSKLLTTSIILLGTQYAGYANAATPVVDKLGAGVSISQDAMSSTVTQTLARSTNTWKTIDTKQGESLNFVMPSTSAVSINKVTSGQVTNFMGQLNSTVNGAQGGHIVILNDAGLTFAAGSQVNVGALTASTAKNITLNKDGTYTLKDFSNKAVEFNGYVAIKAPADGYINAIAREIKVGQTGSLNVDSGRVDLEAGSKSYTVDLAGNGKVFYSTPKLDSGKISVLGNIQSDDVVIRARANDIASSVINLTGVVDSKVLNVSASGDINQSGTLNQFSSNPNNPESLTVNLSAGRDVNLTPTSKIYGNSDFFASQNGTIGQTDVTINAGRDANLSGYIVGDATYNSGKGASVTAGRNINADKNLSTYIQGPLGGLDLTAKQNINIDGRIYANDEFGGKHSINMQAGNNINLGSNSNIVTDSGLLALTTKTGNISVASQNLYSQGTLSLSSGKNLDISGNVNVSFVPDTLTSPTLSSVGDTKISGAITSSTGLNVKSGGNVDLSGANINANAVTYYPYGAYGYNNKDITNVNITAKRGYIDNAATKIATSGDNGGKLNIIAARTSSFNGTYTADSYQSQLSNTPSPVGSIALQGGKGTVYKGNAYTVNRNGVAANNVSVYYDGAAHFITGNGDIASQLPAVY